MNKRKKHKNLSSIAIKINSNHVRDLFFKFLIIDIAILILIIVIWAVNNEKSFYGEIVNNAQRSFDISTTGTLDYKVIWPDGKIMIRDLSTFIYGFRKAIIVVAILEGILLLDKVIFGTAKIRKALKPLDEIAKTADRLSNITFNEEKFQNLEEAIDKISPTISEERINIGDSELQGLEEAINKLLDRMRESYKQQARFVSDASHELRTPISVIQGYANMLDRWGKKDESVLEESIIAIKSEAESMKVLVEQLLFLARGINRKTELTLEEISLKEMIKEVFEESKMIDKSHSYRLIDSEEIKILGDYKLLKQTARILVENAVKYTEKDGEIILKVGLSEKDEPYFSIEDTGIGMDENDVPHIFERFFRADTARVRKDGGAGLGLSIAKWIIDNHRGYFAVLTRKDVGTRITVFFPKQNY